MPVRVIKCKVISVRRKVAIGPNPFVDGRASVVRCTLRTRSRLWGGTDVIDRIQCGARRHMRPEQLALREILTYVAGAVHDVGLVEIGHGVDMLESEIVADFV